MQATVCPRKYTDISNMTYTVFKALLFLLTACLICINKRGHLFLCMEADHMKHAYSNFCYSHI